MSQLRCFFFLHDGVEISAMSSDVLFIDFHPLGLQKDFISNFSPTFGETIFDWNLNKMCLDCLGVCSHNIYNITGYIGELDISCLLS